MDGPVQYMIRVRGELGPQWSEWFGGMAVVCQGNGITELVGVLADQAALHGVLAQVRDLGLVLLGVEQVYQHSR